MGPLGVRKVGVRLLETCERYHWDKAGADEQPRQRQTLEKPKDERSDNDSSGVVEGYAQGVQASEKLRPQQNKKRYAYSSRNDGGDS